MLDVKSLKAEMVRNGYTQSALAAELGITPRTFSNRLNTGDFGVKEIEIIARALNLKDPFSIFFANIVT